MPLHPTATPSLTNPGSYLSGEMFVSETGKPMALACVISKVGAPNAAIEIYGSVKANISDLIVEGITFQDTNGNQVAWNKLDKQTIEDASLGRMERAGFGENALKARIMRQIIRKHLIDEGLQPDGPYVRICSAVG